MTEVNFSTLKKKNTRGKSFSNMRHSLNLEKTRQRLKKPFENSAEKSSYQYRKRRNMNLLELRNIKNIPNKGFKP